MCFGCSKNRLFETVLLSTHNICFGLEIRKSFSVTHSYLGAWKICFWPCSLAYQYWPGGFMLFVVLYPATPEGSTGSGSGFKASQKTRQRLKVSSDRLGEAGNRTCDPWFTRHRFIPYTTAKIFQLRIFFPTKLHNE